MLIEPGKYIATVEDFGIRVSAAKKTPSLNVKFKLKGNGKSVFWEKYLTVGTMDFVVDALTSSELLNTKKFSDLAKGVDGGGLKTDKEVEVTVVHEEYTDKDGNAKTAVKVEFINPLNGGAMKGALAADEAVSVLAGLNLDAAIMQSEQRTGKSVTIETQTKDSGATPTTFSDDSIPF